MSYVSTIGRSFYSSTPKKALGTIKPGSTAGLSFPTKPPLSASDTPATPPRSGASVLPPDPAYEATIGGLAQQRDNTVAGLTQQRGAGLSAYGYTEDPTSHAIAYDPNNPYSQASLLRKHYQQAKTGNTNSYAAAGQLYAGSLQNAQNASTDQFQQGDNSLTNSVIQFLANNTQAQNQASNNYDLNAAGALGQSIANAPNNPLYDNSPNVVTAGPGGQALVPQSATSTVKLANGWSVLYDNTGKAIRFIPPGG